jgi:hypothetical protein
MAACVLTSYADPGDEAKLTPERGAFVERLTGELQLETADDSKTPLARCEKSIQKWSWERNGFTDGQTYVWGLKGRPQAIGGAFLIPAEKKAHYEFVSLSPAPLICRRDGETVWTPPAVDLAWKEIPAAPKAADTPRARARQLGALAEKIGGVARMGPPRYAEGSRWELRLLPTPVYRYSDANQGVLDGAIFLMVMGTDPQLVLLIEAREEDRKTTWKAAFARLSGFELAASIGDKEIWQSPVVKDGHARDSVWHLSQPLDAAKLFAK